MMLNRSEPRDGYAVRVLAVHTTEGSGTAESLRDATWWTGSSHALADASGKLLTPAEGCVPYDLAAWTLRSGNRWSENIELVGYAAWKRPDWLAHPDLLDACARWLAARSTARGIPLVKLTAAQYRAGGSGVIGHVDHTIGYSDGTHWDPGPDFPYDVVLAKANAYRTGTPIEEDEMADPNVVKLIQENHNMLDALIRLGLNEQIARLSVTVVAQGEILKQLAQNNGAAIDMAAIEAVVEKGVSDAIAGIEATVTVKPSA